MDIRLTADDRVGAGDGHRARKGAKKPARPARGKSRRGAARRPGGPLRLIARLTYWGFILTIWAGVLVVGVVAYYGLQLPSSQSWAVPDRPANIRIVAADGRLLSNRGKMGGEAVSIRELPHYVPAAVIAIEDRRFQDHFGVDPIGILRALISNALAGHIVEGGSTITQQVAKNLFLTPDQNLGRKIQEALLALWLEQTYTKAEILELYINRVYFGAGAYGIEAAAQRYFGKSARNLSLGEAAILAGVLQAPSRLSPDTHPEAAAERARLVLNAMAEEGYISDAEAEAAAIDPNKRIRTRVAGAEYYVADWVEQLMASYLGEVDQDVVVHTTIDWDLQKQAEFVIRDTIIRQGEARNFSQGALVAMQPDGTIQAIVGGTDYSQSQYNRAITARRQMGSAFKPIVYLTAIEAGLTPDTVVEDTPFDYNGWSPENFNGEFHGRVALRDALANSLNVVAAKLCIQLGPANVVSTAYRLGISSHLDPVPSIALGTAEISLLDLTSAYAPFANGGVGIIAHVISRIETADGEVLYDHIPAGPGRVISEHNVEVMNQMLSYAVETGTGKRARLGDWPIAGKTGTTQDFRDAVFIGYSARMVTGVWLGNDDNSPMQSVGGGSFPAEIWTEFMNKAHEGLPVAALPGVNSRFAQPPPTAEDTAAPPRRRNIGDFLRDLFGGN